MRILALAVVIAATLISMPWSSAAGASTPTTNAAAAAPAQGNADHGRYIVTHVAMCIECHSPRDDEGNILAGHEFLGASLPFTPPSGWAQRVPRNRGLLGYDDELAMRLLTQGAIGRHGEQLKLPMPRFRMTQADAADVIAFMRSLQ
jgi:hypothetical protein